MSGEVFDCEIQVRLRDLNVGGHVDNVEIARVISEARVLFLRYADLGGERPGLFSELPAGVAELVASQTVEYRSEMFFSPFQPYLARMWVSKIGRTSFTLGTEIRTAPDGPPAALAETVQVMRDTRAGQMWQIDEANLASFERFLGAPVALRGRG
ncbi:acyl-CoA thioesterase [Nocardioides dubius]|uniref:Acyl-CoA thioester hydrolase n=1 Tax=Nocardioides dubius TaxID=317019 RepID=A0ABN1TYB4_9ACTN